MLAAHLGAALDNRVAIRELTELEAARRETVLQLQEAVRPRLPEIEGVEFGVHYLASEPGALTGGDFYDVQMLPNGDLHLVVVDVMGKGVAATKNALAIAHVLRVLAMEGCPLEQLVSQADQLFRGEGPELVATLLVASYRPSTGHVRFAGGGHPPPVLVRAGGKAEFVDAPGTPIGWPGAGSDGVIEIDLDRSDAIILYTDGLVEARGDIVDGLAVFLEAAAATAEYPAPYQARGLVDRTLMGADRKDDSLALVLRRRAAPPAKGVHHLGPFEYRFAPNPAAATLARHFLSDWLDRQPVDPASVGDLLLVASELCTNAMYAAQDRGSQVVLRVAAEDDSIAIAVENEGDGFAWQRSADPPDPDLESGRGLFLVEALTDELTVQQDPNRTVVRCLKRYVVAQRPGS
jgi:anti-sigma regulatory factor (Ser/Thr protein kinase)